MTDHPNFLIVCGHGTVADHSGCEHSRDDYSGFCTEVSRVALLPWFPGRPGWWAAEDVDSENVKITLMEGNQHGWSLARMFEGWSESEEYERRVSDWYIKEGREVPDDPRREHIEIRCAEERCTTWAIRSDGDRLQALLMKIATEHNSQCPECGVPFTPIVSADEKLIVVTLQQFHLAQKHAERHYGMLA